MSLSVFRNNFVIFCSNKNGNNILKCKSVCVFTFFSKLDRYIYLF